MAIAMILLAISTVQANADEVAIKVHFKNTENWSNVGVYVWDSNDSQFVGGWPGQDISNTKDGDWYTATLTGYPESQMNIIFNDGGAGRQTVDIKLDLTKGTEWWLVPSGESGGKITCAIAKSQADAEGGKGETPEEFAPQAPANPTIKKSPVIDGNKVTFYYECTNADKVQIAGSMDNWTMTDMKKDGNVYSYTYELPAGDYQYKFIVNGNIWLIDPLNETTVDDGNGNINSGFTVTAGASVDTNPAPTVTSPEIKGGKVTFNYASTTASKVEVFGSFNYWSSGFEMFKDGDVFTYTMELPNGEYEYKFVVDGNWINDPANSNKKGDNNVFTVTEGVEAPQVPDEPAYTPTITQSVVIDGNKVTIYYESPDAEKVEFMSSANEWAGVEMTKDGNVYSITLELAKGEYTYKFLLNGSDWICDPLNNENLDGDGNSIFVVTADTLVETPDEPETPGTEVETESSSEVETDSEASTENEQSSEDTPTDKTPAKNNMVVVIVAIIIIVAALGGLGAYFFIKKKNA